MDALLDALFWVFISVATVAVVTLLFAGTSRRRTIIFLFINHVKKELGL